MKVAIRAMGNSRGLLIPKQILEQIGFQDAADLQVVNGVIEIRPIKRKVRQGWLEDSQRIAQTGTEELAWPEFTNDADKDLAW